MFARKQSVNQRGDTIIEVLIAVAIVSLVLTAAYALTNKNVAATQEVQEQAYAQKMVEQQVELLRSSAPPAQKGCYKTTDGTFAVAATPAPNPDPCAVTHGGATYHMLITPPSGSSSTYTVKADWDTVTGSRANITVYYKVAS